MLTRVYLENKSGSTLAKFDKCSGAERGVWTYSDQDAMQVAGFASVAGFL